MAQDTNVVEYVLNDESVTNSHGFVLLNAAGNFERYKANPVMLFAHDTENLIGQMTDLRIDGTRLIGKPVFDEEDTLAAKCKRQADKGILKGCSPGIIINAVELRTDVRGEERMTVTDWELCEVSLVSVPSNRNALKLYNKEGDPIPDDLVKLNIEDLLKNITKKMDNIILTSEAYVALDLKPGEADGKAISAAVMEMKARMDRSAEELLNIRRMKADELVDNAVKTGRIHADKKAEFVKLANTDYDLAKSTLDAIPERESLSGKMKKTEAGAPSGRDAWSYLKWAKEDPEGLKRMKTEDPDAFAELKKHIR